RECECAVDRLLGQQLAEHDDAGLEDGAALGAARRALIRPRIAPAAVEADDFVERAVYRDHVPGPGPLVQAVDVLRNDCSHETARLELGEGAVRVVRLHAPEQLATQRVELPDLLGIAAER